MSGRAYTMKEMRSIVEYVNSRKAYGDYKGRKLWTDFASSNLTNRTWQSLKETFLKRILPDIHNPYFGLTKSEICSFKHGYDVDARNKNKLDIQTISDDSNHSNAGNVQDNEKPSTSYNNEAGASSGEKISPSTLNARTRASTETIILENCYENAEDIQRDLESPKNKKDTGSQDEKGTQNKCLRDLITYAEPLTPMMQQVLDDFATEDELGEGELVEAELEILESANTRNEENCNKSDSELHKDKGQTDKKCENSIEKIEDRLSEIVHCSDSIKIPLGQDSKVSESNSVRKSSDLVDNDDVKNVTKKVGEISYSLDKIAKNKDFVNLTNDTATQNTNNSTDTIIPENQEALKNGNTESSKVTDTTKEVSKKLSLSRKRSFSLNFESNLVKKKKLVPQSKDVTQLETEDKIKKYCIDNKTKTNKGNDENNGETTNNSQSIEENKAVGSRDGNFSQINPCLKSVSLYDAQFIKTKYTDSDSSDNLVIDAIVEAHKEKKDEQDINKEDKQNKKIVDVNKEKVEENKNKEKETANINEDPPKILKNAANISNIVMLQSHSESDDSKEKDTENRFENPPKNLENAANINEIVMLNSHSDSDGSNEVENGVNQGKTKQKKIERQNALAKVFGFSSGVVSSDRKRKINRVRRSPSYRHNDSNSSEWTSESDSEYVSPSRGRRNRYDRKYLKPRSGRVLQLEEDGALFVLHGKKIYPLVSDGTAVRNYLTFSPQSDAEDDPAYWKKKYKEERRKTEELKKMVEEAKTKPAREQSPVLPTSSRQSALPEPEVITIPEEPKVLMPPENPKQEKSDEKTLKIKFTKNNEELQVEGVWSQIYPALANVVQIFTKDPQPTKEVPSNSNTNGKSDADEIVSLRSTPIDEEAVRKKVAKLEEEIFKEIEELEKSEQEATTKDQEANVNKKRRAGRPRKSTTALKSADSSSSPGRPRRAKEPEKATVEDQKEIEKENGQSEVENEKENDQLTVTKELPKRRARTPKKYNNENLVASVKSKSPKRTGKSTNPEPEPSRPASDDDDALYMFPPTRRTRKSSTKTVNDRR